METRSSTVRTVRTSTEAVRKWRKANTNKWREDRRKNLPYGIWTLEDGGQVLFNRYYLPLWERRPDGTIIPRDHTPWGTAPNPEDGRWVKWKTQRWLYDDGTPELQKREAGMRALAEWGL